MRMKALHFAMMSALGLGALALAPASMAAPQDQDAMNSSQMNSSQGMQEHDSGMADSNTLDCNMQFVLDGWSAAYSTADGHGTVKCANGKTLPVTLDAKGGGLTVGAYKINDGHASFTNVTNIKDVLGDYGMAKAHVGAAKTAQGAVMTNGDVSMSLGGTGDGWDIGVGFGKFTIKAANGMNKSDMDHDDMDDDSGL